MDGNEIPTGDALVERAKNGDAAAFAGLYEGIYVELYRFAFYMMKNAHDAEDVVSEAVISAFEHISKLKKASAFRSWMFTIVSNGCKKRLGAQKNVETQLSEAELEQGTGSETSEELSLEDSQDLAQALSRLSEEERLIVVMLVLGGYNSKEVGEILSLNPVTVRSKQKRALAKMKHFLDGKGGI